MQEPAEPRPVRNFRPRPPAAPRAAWLAATLTATALAADPVATPSRNGEETSSGHRIVHVFDFSESEAGNLEAIPKFWEPLRFSGFPHYTRGEFDTSVGHNAPPSFHLSSEGRSVAFMYRGPDTRVRVNTDYRIAGHLRPDRLRFARACLTAVYLNERGEPLLDSLVRTPHLPTLSDEKESGNDGWIRFGLTLPPAPNEAATIGLVAWILQEDQWRDPVPASRHLPFRDVHGGAWLDDITIIALPRVELTTSSSSNVLTPPLPQVVLPLVADQREGGLSNVLTIRDVDGREILQRTISTQHGASVAAEPVAVDHLPPGIYQARLDVRSRGRSIATREVRFARLSGPLNSSGGARSFGISLHPGARVPVDTEIALLRAQGALSVKLPVWSADTAGASSASGTLETDRLLHALERDGFALTGVLFDPSDGRPSRDGTARPTLHELLSSSPAAWQDHLAAQAAPFAGMFRSWQLGSDGTAASASHAQTRTALEQLREIMRRFVTMPRFVLPVPFDIERPTPPWPVEQLCVNISASLPRDTMANLMDDARREYELVQVFATPQDTPGLQRVPRLAEWARRLLAIRHAGSNVAYVPQTWAVHESPLGRTAEPTEEFVVLHTLISHIGDATPGPEIYLGKGITALTFQRGDDAVLAVWAEDAPSQSLSLTLQVGGATEAIDLWGNRAPLRVDREGRTTLVISDRPLLIPGVPFDLVALQEGVRLDTTRFDAGAARQTTVLTIRNPEATGRNGSLRLIAPEEWDITPTRFDFVAPPRSTFTQTLNVDIPPNALAGAREIRAELTLTDGARIDVLLPVTLGLEGIDVRGLAYLSDNVLQVRQVVFNHTNETVHFRGSALLPGMERQYRPITSLAPGSSQAVQYRFDHAAHFAGKTVRLELRELNDGRRTHAMDVAIP